MSLSHRELEDLKYVLSDTVKEFLGFNEATLVSAALNCVTKGYDKQKTVDKLSDLLDGRQASHFADIVQSAFDNYRQSKRRHKRKKKDHVDDHGNAKGKTRRVADGDDEAVATSRQKVQNSASSTPKLGDSDILTPDKIKQMMEHAQKELQERKLQLGLGPGSAVLGSYPATNQSMAEAEFKSRRSAELQSQIQTRLMGLSMGLGTVPNMSLRAMQQQPAFGGMGVVGALPTEPSQAAFYVSGQQSATTKQAPQVPAPPVILNEMGQTIDAKTGQMINLSQYTPTLKANIRAKRREQFKGLIEKPPEEVTDGKFFDPRMSQRGSSRLKRTFKFHDKGKFEQLGQRLRAKAQLDRLQAEIAQTAKRTGIASAAKIATIVPKIEVEEGVTPIIEWWDSFIILTEAYEALTEGPASGQLEGITNLVEHPIQIKPPAVSDMQTAIPVFMTKKERKKLRKQGRQEAQRDLQEKIRIGLAPVPEPKVRMANLMRVLGTEAVQDPTKVEAHVRAQMAKRQRAHEEANAERKLTTAQRREKKMEKVKEDTSLGVHVSLYRVRDLSSLAHRFKIETNCRQLFMTGFVVLYKDCNIVVVEGGPKQQRKFRRLMLHRIKWAETKKRTKGGGGSDDEDHHASNKGCALVWEGMVKSRAFGDMKFKTCPTESFAADLFRKNSVGHYWDLAFTGAVLETAADD